MRRKTQASSLGALVLAALLAPTAAANTLKVPTAAFPTIQSAVTAAQPSDVVEIKKGIYFESVSVNLKTSVRIRGKKGAIIDSGGAAVGLAVTSSTSIEVSGLTVREAMMAAFRTIGSVDVTFSRCMARSIDGIAFSISGGGAVRVLNCRAEDVETGVSTYSAGVFVRDSRFRGCSGIGAVLKGSTIAFVRNSLEIVTTSTAVLVGDGSQDSASGVLLNGNRIRGVGGSGTAIRLDGVLNCEVSENRIDDAVGIGIQAGSSSGVTLARNRIQDVGGNGVQLDCADSVVRGNVVRRTGAIGLEIRDGADGSLILRNSIRDATDDGIHVGSDCDLAVLIENVAKQSGDFDLVDEGNNTRLMDNVFGTIAT